MTVMWPLAVSSNAAAAVEDSTLLASFDGAHESSNPVVPCRYSITGIVVSAVLSGTPTIIVASTS